MEPDYTRIWPYVFAALMVFVIYRRLRRSFGRQPWSPVRMRIRLALLALVGCGLAPTTLQSAGLMLAAVCGAVAGVGLGTWGAAHTRYQRMAGRLYYLPHTYTGILVTMLFLGRLIYRIVMLSSGVRTGGDPVTVDAPSAYLGDARMMTSPLTIGLLYVLVGYYVVFYARLMWKVKRIAPEDIEVEPTSSANS